MKKLHLLLAVLLLVSLQSFGQYRFEIAGGTGLVGSTDYSEFSSPVNFAATFGYKQNDNLFFYFEGGINNAKNSLGNTNSSTFLSIGAKNNLDLGIFYVHLGGTLGVSFNKYGDYYSDWGTYTEYILPEKETSLYLSAVIEIVRYIDIEQKYGILLRSGMATSGSLGFTDITLKEYDQNNVLINEYTEATSLGLKFIPVMLGFVVNI